MIRSGFLLGVHGHCCECLLYFQNYNRTLYHSKVLPTSVVIQRKLLLQKSRYPWCLLLVSRFQAAAGTERVAVLQRFVPFVLYAACDSLHIVPVLLAL